jgi:ComF family protein
MAKTFDAVVPVPLHPAKARKRGYNQAEMIAAGITEITHTSLASDCLLRTGNTRTQTRKSREARWRNVRNAFELKQDPPKRLLLVDDVITTGARLEACIKTLADAERPPEYVAVACIGMARA